VTRLVFENIAQKCRPSHILAKLIGAQLFPVEISSPKIWASFVIKKDCPK
jgi:hypothetical protein